jgi:hypothetical protein
MKRQGVRHCALGMLLGLALCAGPASHRVAAAGSSELDDRWLSVMAAEELARAAGDGNWAALEKRAQTLILQRLSCGHLDKMQALNDLLYVLRASRYLAMADQLDPTRKFSAWLAGNRGVSRLLFRAVQDVASPPDALARFQSLWAADDKRVSAYAELAVAFATSEPLGHYVKQPNPASLQESFDWFTNSNVAFRYDLKAMPYELSRYLADTRLSLAERRWAVQQYSNKASLEATYHAPPFDAAYFFDGYPKGLSRLEYTLPNILKAGGLCIDQAYFSSQVCKTLGSPAAIIVGVNMAGSAHAWLTNIEMRPVGGRMTVQWDSSTGRYVEQKWYTGTVTDPASRKKIHDSELVLLGAAALLPLDRREEADAAAALAAMIVPLAPSAPASRPVESVAAAGVDELRRLAEEFNRKPASKPDSLKADLSQIQPARGIDSALVEDLLVEAVTNNLANSRVWEMVVESRKAGTLSTRCLDRLLEFLVTRTAKDYPDYSCQIVMQILPTYEDPNRRKTVFLKALEVYQERVDLQGHLKIAWGDDLASHGYKEQALGVYQQVIASKTRDVTEVLVNAAKRVEELLVAENHRDAAIKMYTQLFSELKKPALDGGFTQSSFYLVGRRLAELLTEAGQGDAARKVQQKIGPSIASALEP